MTSFEDRARAEAERITGRSPFANSYIEAFSDGAKWAREQEPFRDNRITHRICPPGCEETRPHYHRTDTVGPILE